MRLMPGKQPGEAKICETIAMRFKINSTWLTAAIGIAACGIALMYPSAGVALLVVAALVLLAGVRIDDSHLIWFSKGKSRILFGVLALICVTLGGAWYFGYARQADHSELPPPKPSTLPLESRMARFVYTCATRPLDFDAVTKRFKEEVIPEDEKDGFLTTIAPMLNGVHIEKEAITDKAKRTVGLAITRNGFTKVVFEARTVSPTELHVVESWVVPSEEKEAFLTKPNLRAPYVSEITSATEDYFGIRRGNCRLD